MRNIIEKLYLTRTKGVALEEDDAVVGGSTVLEETDVAIAVAGAVGAPGSGI